MDVPRVKELRNHGGYSEFQYYRYVHCQVRPWVWFQEKSREERERVKAWRW